VHDLWLITRRLHWNSLKNKDNKQLDEVANKLCGEAESLESSLFFCFFCTQRHDKMCTQNLVATLKSTLTLDCCECIDVVRIVTFSRAFSQLPRTFVTRESSRDHWSRTPFQLNNRSFTCSMKKNIILYIFPLLLYYQHDYFIYPDIRKKILLLGALESTHFFAEINIFLCNCDAWEIIKKLI